MPRSDMVPIIANEALEGLCVVDYYESFIWSKRYYDVGDFQLVVGVGTEAARYAREGYYVLRDGHKEAGIIERVEIMADATGHETMTISGRFLSSILGRRIIARQTQVSGTIANCVRKLVNENAISPTDANRRIPNLGYASWIGLPSTSIEQQYTGKNLLEAIQGICQQYGIGYEVELGEGGVFEFALYVGVDRSYAQTANPYVVFSPDYENLASSDYSEDYSSKVTDVLVAGEGEGLERKTVWASNATNSGLARYEAFVDARNASTNGGEISESVYLAQLREEGLESLYSVLTAFAGEVSLVNYELGVDFACGDVVTIENARWGVSANARLIEVIESVDAAGAYTVVPTFDITSM